MATPLEYVSVTLIAYLLGSFPTAFLLARLTKGLDIRNQGSGNVGALNTYRQLGKLGAGLVLAVDTGKGVLVIYIVRWMGSPEAAMYVAAIAAVVGHNWPFYLRFRGGRGAAVVLGISSVVLPLITAIAFLATVLVILFTRNALVSIVAGFFVLNVLTIATLQTAPMIALCLLLSAMVAGTYFVRVGAQLVPAIMRRDWREITRIE